MARRRLWLCIWWDMVGSPTKFAKCRSFAHLRCTTKSWSLFWCLWILWRNRWDFDLQQVGDFFSQWGLVTLVYRDKASWQVAQRRCKTEHCLHLDGFCVQGHTNSLSRAPMALKLCKQIMCSICPSGDLCTSLPKRAQCGSWEESALLSFFELCFLMFLRTFRAALSLDLKKWPGKAALPIIEENSTSRPADEATSFALCTGHDLHGATHGMCVPFSLAFSGSMFSCLAFWLFVTPFLLLRTVPESLRVEKGDERRWEDAHTDHRSACSMLDRHRPATSSRSRRSQSLHLSEQRHDLVKRAIARQGRKAFEDPKNLSASLSILQYPSKRQSTGISTRNQPLHTQARFLIFDICGCCGYRK